MSPQYKAWKFIWVLKTELHAEHFQFGAIPEKCVDG